MFSSKTNNKKPEDSIYTDYTMHYEPSGLYNSVFKEFSNGELFR